MTSTVTRRGHAVAPTRPDHPRRLDGLDLARGLAVLGMVTAHFGPLRHGFDWMDPSSWSSLTDGRSAVLFALCAGVSLTLATRPRPGEDTAALVDHRRHVLLRALALWVVGALLVAVDSPVLVILPTYSVCFVATLPFLRARTRTVALVAAAALLIGPVVYAVGLPAVLRAPADPLVKGVLFGGYPGITWWGIVLVGLLVGRLPLHAPRAQGLMVGVGALAAAVGYGGGALLRRVLGLPPSSVPVGSNSTASGSADADGGGSATGGVVGPGGTAGAAGADTGGTGGAAGAEAGWSSAGTASDAPVVRPQGGGTVEHPEIDWGGLSSIDPHAGSTPEVLGALGVAVGVLGLCLLVSGRTGWLLAPVRAVGTLALTVYAAHIVAFAVLQRTAGDWLGAGWAPAASVMAGALVLVTAWRSRLGSGPLERLVRWASRSLDGPGRRSRTN